MSRAPGPTPAPPGDGWKLVMGLLLAVPLLFALTLSRWLGTPKERLDPPVVFAALGLPSVEVRNVESLDYGELFFIRFDTQPAERSGVLRALAAFEVSRGLADKPISLKLEREWWSPPSAVEGTYWKKGRSTVWNPDNQPDTFFAVVEKNRQP